MWSFRLSIRIVALFCIIGGTVFLLSNCAFRPLKKEVKILDQTAHIYGTISHGSRQEKPIIILLYQVLPNENKLVAYSIDYQSSKFHFVTFPGQFIVAAFEDANEDLRYQKEEYAGYYGAPDVITLEPGTNVQSLNVTLQSPDVLSLNESPDLSHSAIKAEQGLRNPRIAIGEVAKLEDSRFTYENGQMGLWESIRFWETVGGGIYFLEPFNQGKTPVLFIHGAGGHPKEWAGMVKELDRSKFQPWVAFYPSGFRLSWIAEGMDKLLTEVFVTHKFNKFVVIAHSMGGMIARSLINHIVERDARYKPQILFITISTPWGGHQAAQFGVDFAPAVIPSWVDMVPNSPFQQTLFQTPWPERMKYYLLFSFKGGRNPFTNGNDDGTVSLISQLKPDAQEAAVHSFGFNEDHRSILKSSEVSKKINQILLSN